MSEIISLFTAFGPGSIVTALIQAWLAQRSKRDERGFAEKQTAYVGLLEAYYRAAVEGNDANSKAFAYWRMRCELVAPHPVRDAIRRIVETNHDPPAHEKADRDMREAMRADLGVTR